jgi:hypothetical protein
MWEICIVIHGKRHCFPLPILVEKFHIPGPGPINFPELELATTVLELVKVVQPQVGQSQFARQLSDVSTQFIQQVQKGLPSGVDLHQAEAR